MGGKSRTRNASTLRRPGRQRHFVHSRHVAAMPLDPGTVHRFAMLERAVKSFAKTGRFDESLKLIEELLAIAPEDAGLSKLKARLAADLVKQAAQAQKISAATEILTLVDAKIPAAHLGEQEKALLSKSRESLYSM